MPDTKIPNPILSAGEINALLDRIFPQISRRGSRSFTCEAVGPLSGRMRLHYHERHLRPGGTISGPAMFGLADVALYATILAHIGPVALAVTTNMSINFLRKPGPGDLIAQCRLLKLGKRLAVGEVTMCSEGSSEIAAHVTGTYSIPPGTK